MISRDELDPDLREQLDFDFKNQIVKLNQIYEEIDNLRNELREMITNTKVVCGGNIIITNDINENNPAIALSSYQGSRLDKNKIDRFDLNKLCLSDTDFSTSNYLDNLEKIHVRVYETQEENSMCVFSDILDYNWRLLSSINTYLNKTIGQTIRGGTITFEMPCLNSGCKVIIREDIQMKEYTFIYDRTEGNCNISFPVISVGEWSCELELKNKWTSKHEVEQDKLIASRVGNLVTINGCITKKGKTKIGEIITIIPKGFRPTRIKRVFCIIFTNDNERKSYPVSIDINSTGELCYFGNDIVSDLSKINGFMSFNITYSV